MRTAWRADADTMVPRPPRGADGLILVVDDDAVVRRATRLVLEGGGFRVATAIDGAAAQALMRLTRPDVVLLDVELPDGSGLDLLPVLRAVGEDVPIIMFTGSEAVDVLRAAFAAGARDYLTKPYVPEVLLARVGAAQQLGRSVRELAEANLRLRRLAEVDDLTGLINRRALRELLEDAAAHAERGGEGFGVVLMDLDEFKQVNDSQGHAAGDQALGAVAASLQQVSRREDHVGRWGGDEFLAILAGADLRETRRAAERFRAAVAAGPSGVVVSCGVAVGGAGVTPDAILGAADLALYAAKAQRAAAQPAST